MRLTDAELEAINEALGFRLAGDWEEEDGSWVPYEKAKAKIVKELARREAKQSTNKLRIYRKIS